MSATITDCVLVITPEFYNPDYGYEMGAIWPGLQGCYGTHFFCGHDLDLAIRYVNDLNYARGHTPEFVTAVFEMAMGLNAFHYFDS